MDGAGDFKLTPTDQEEEVEEEIGPEDVPPEQTEELIMGRNLLLTSTVLQAPELPPHPDGVTHLDPF
ncbi:hypothetical protein D4764_0292660 [Takifugu flavidus]|uniref:Uncharacterized protein n=1 Tax=Takifugu flavidus TaxID=433684 RepID=A0A5C6MEP4_9TELE|nr:hypothetical protein D4764_0292660 [Takifugu flavidus]